MLLGVVGAFGLYVAVRLSCNHSTLPARAARTSVPDGRPKSKANDWLPLCDAGGGLLLPWPTAYFTPPFHG